MTTAPDLFVIVHGSYVHSWWIRFSEGHYPWWRRWSLFSCALRRAFGDECEVREFLWSGHNAHQARLNAGADLARMLEKEAPDRRIHLIGHSHGGNVALTAVNNLPPGRIASVILLANPHMALLDSRGSPPQWLYWPEAAKHMGRIWNLHSPEDFVQARLAEWLPGLRIKGGKTLHVRSTYGGTAHKPVETGALHFRGRLTAHRSMHSEAIGTLVGALLRGAAFPDAMKAAGLSLAESNTVRDRGGWPGNDRTFEMIREITDPKPFDLGSNSKGVGVLFVHGFTASPAELRPMADAIARSTGWRCIAVLLPGHGTQITDMQHTNGAEWISALGRAYEKLSRECEQVFVVGLSLGAVLACHLAIRQTKDPKLRGLILLAPAFGVTADRAIGIHAGRVVRTLIHKGTRASDYFLDHRLYSYLQIPLNRAAEVLQLGREAVVNMGRLRELPILLFVGDRESTVSLEKMLSVARDNSWIRLVRLPRSRHILPVEPDKEILFEASLRFMEECVVGVSR